MKCQKCKDDTYIWVSNGNAIGVITCPICGDPNGEFWWDNAEFSNPGSGKIVFQTPDDEKPCNVKQTLKQIREGKWKPFKVKTNTNSY